jgi:putative transposase
MKLDTSFTSNAYEPQVLVAELSTEDRHFISIIESLIEPCSKQEYGQRLQAADQQLGTSKRTVQRLVRQWEERGLEGLLNKRQLFQNENC